MNILSFFEFLTRFTLIFYPELTVSMLKFLFDYSYRSIKLILLLLLILSLTTSIETRAQDKSYLAVSAAYFDIWQKGDQSFAARMEYRSGTKIWILKSFTGFMVNSDFAGYIFSGFFVDIPITPNLFITPSFAPGIYSKARSKNLFLLLEFRSQIEIAFQINGSSRIGLSFNHISNASLGKDNPGVENLAITYAFNLE